MSFVRTFSMVTHADHSRTFFDQYFHLTQRNWQLKSFIIQYRRHSPTQSWILVITYAIRGLWYTFLYEGIYCLLTYCLVTYVIHTVYKMSNYQTYLCAILVDHAIILLSEMADIRDFMCFVMTKRISLFQIIAPLIMQY